MNSFAAFIHQPAATAVVPGAGSKPAVSRPIEEEFRLQSFIPHPVQYGAG